MVQVSHPYMTTGKTIAFTRWTFVGKVMIGILLGRAKLDTDTHRNSEDTGKRQPSTSQRERASEATSPVLILDF